MYMNKKPAIKSDIKSSVCAEDRFGQGNALFSRLVEAHDCLMRDKSLQAARRRSWSGAKSDRNLSTTQIDHPDEFTAKSTESGRPEKAIEFFVIDTKPCLLVRIEGDDERGSSFSINAIANRRVFTPIDYEIPLMGGQVVIDLSSLARKLEVKSWTELRIDFDGAISNPASVSPDRFVHSKKISGGITGLSAAGVLRGWVVNRSTPHLDIPVQVRFDGEGAAYFFASGPYRDNTHLKQFSVQIPPFFMDGQFHRLDFAAMGADTNFQGAPLYFCFADNKGVVLSDLQISNSSFSANIVSPTGLELFVQSALIDQARIRQSTQLLRTRRSYIETAIQKILAKLRLPVPFTPSIPAIAIEQARAAWRDGNEQKRHKLMNRPGRTGKRIPRLSPAPLRYKVKNAGDVIAQGLCDQPSSANDGFTTGMDGLRIAIARPLEVCVLEIADRGIVLASVSLEKLQRLSEANISWDRH